VSKTSLNGSCACRNAGSRIFPDRMEGRILPLDEAGKESRAYRQPLGVIGVISPWNFPMYLSHTVINP
jgi:aldehyde dehydrogenase (NAD+)